MLAPNKAFDQRHDKLYQFYLANGRKLDNLASKYVHLWVVKNEYGYEIKSVHSCDMIADFKGLLDKHGGNPFSTYIPIYDLLKAKKYPLNPDGSITLRSPYDNLDIYQEGEAVICYRNDLKEGHATRANIKLIYDHFYGNYKDDDNNPDREASIYLGRVAIQQNTVRYHKDKGGVESSSCFDILKLGDKLSEEHLKFLAGIE